MDHRVITSACPPKAHSPALNTELNTSTFKHRVNDADNFRLYHTSSLGWRGPLHVRACAATYRGFKTSTRLLQLASWHDRQEVPCLSRTNRQTLLLTAQQQRAANAGKGVPLPHVYGSYGLLEVRQPVGHFAFTFNTCDTSLVTPRLNARRSPHARHIGHIFAICRVKALGWPKYDIEGLQCQPLLGFPYLPLRSWRCRYMFALGRTFCLNDQRWET